MLAFILIIKEEEELYTEINHLNKDTIKTNHALFQTPKQELTKILQSKKSFLHKSYNIEI